MATRLYGGMNASEQIRCKSCGRVLLKVSETGLVHAESVDETGCDTCTPFSALYDALRQADENWMKAAPKKDTSHAKVKARENHRKTHMEFDNWLMGVEDRMPPSETRENDDPIVCKQAESTIKSHAQNVRQGTKRARSASPTSEQAESPMSAKYQKRASPPLEADTGQLMASPRRLSTAAPAKRKRLKFADSVEFKEEYRDSTLFQRGADSYVKGRYAAEEGADYLDTSGSLQTFLKFTLEKRVKDKWVEVDEKEVEKGNKYTGELRKLGVSPSGPSQEASGKASMELVTDPDALTDTRAQRSVRRSRTAAQKQGSVGASRDSGKEPQGPSHAEVDTKQNHSNVGLLPSAAGYAHSLTQPASVHNTTSGRMGALSKGPIATKVIAASQSDRTSSSPITVERNSNHLEIPSFKDKGREAGICDRAIADAYAGHTSRPIGVIDAGPDDVPTSLQHGHHQVEDDGESKVVGLSTTDISFRSKNSIDSQKGLTVSNTSSESAQLASSGADN